MKIAVMGAGAMGGYFGGRLAEAGHEVWLIARGDHLKALKADGLRIVSPKGDAHVRDIAATDDPREVGVADVILFTVKNKDVEAAAEAIVPMLGPETFAVTVQNGISAWERLGAVIGVDRVVPGVARLPGDIAEPGVIRHSAEFDMLTFGEISGQRSKRVEAFHDALKGAGAMPAIHDNILHDLWTKFCFQSTFASVTTLTRLDAGPLRDCPALLALFRSAVEEAYSVGRAVVPDLPETSPGMAMSMFQERIPHAAHASMLDDLNRGKPLEHEYLSGDIVRLGQRHGVPTPVHGMFDALLRPLADGMG